MIEGLEPRTAPRRSRPPASLKSGENVTGATAGSGLSFYDRNRSNSHISVTLFPNPKYTERG